MILRISNTWAFWLSAMIRTSIGGASNSLAAVLVAPEQFNMQHPKKLIEMAFAGGFIAVIHYLQKSPLPSGIGEESTTVTVSQTVTKSESQ